MPFRVDLHSPRHGFGVVVHKFGLPTHQSDGGRNRLKDTLYPPAAGMNGTERNGTEQLLSIPT
jgi:hypothetical protein